MRNIAKKFKMTMSLIDIETVKPRYKCFFGEDVELCISVVDEDKKPLDLTDVNAKVYYTCDKFEPLRQDNDITINEPYTNGTINILVNKKYLRLGVNTIRVALFDSDQEVLLQPCQVNCIETGIDDEHGDIIVNDDINVKDEFIKTNNKVSIVDNRLKAVEGNIPEIKSELVDINEQLDNIEKKVNDHIESCSGGETSIGETSIDDTTISTDRTWSSAKIEDFVHTNDDVVWSTVQGENLSIDYTKEGYLREVEIWGNTIQNEEDLSDIQHLGELYVDEEGQPILDNEGRKQYKIEVESCNDNLNTTDSIYILEGNQSYPTIKLDNTAFKPSTKYEVTIKVLENTLDAEIVDFTAGHVSVFSGRLPGMTISKGFIGEKKAIQSTVSDFSNRLENYTFRYECTQATTGYVKLKICIRERDTLSNIGYIPRKSHKTTLLLPCQLMKVGDVADRLYWDSSKGRYVVEKKVDKMSITSIQSAGYEVDDYRYGGRFSDARFESSIMKGEGIFSHGKYINRNTAEEPTFNALYGKTVGGNFGIKILKTEMESQDEAGLNKWLEGKEVYSYQPLVTTQLIETNITKEILVPCYKDKTHLFVTGGIDGTIKAKVPLDGGQAIQSLSTMNLALNEEVSTLSLENEELKQMDNELVATSWDMDFRMCEIEWTLEDLGIGQEISTMSLENNIIKNTKGSVSNMALTRFEQAKIMIIGGVYNKETLTKQLTTYLNRGYLTQEEYDELIALMEAKDLVVEE